MSGEWPGLPGSDVLPSTSSKFDIAEFPCDKEVVKAGKILREEKTAGTLARHRPLMNKLSGVDHRRLRRSTAELLVASNW